MMAIQSLLDGYPLLQESPARKYARGAKEVHSCSAPGDGFLCQSGSAAFCDHAQDTYPSRNIRFVVPFTDPCP